MSVISRMVLCGGGGPNKCYHVKCSESQFCCRWLVFDTCAASDVHMTAVLNEITWFGGSHFYSCSGMVSRSQTVMPPAMQVGVVIVLYTCI
jgi:hypothetical protein